MSLSDNNIYCPQNFVDHETENDVMEGEWRKYNENILVLQDLKCVSSNNYSKHAASIRNEYS